MYGSRVRMLSIMYVYGCLSGLAIRGLCVDCYSRAAGFSAS